jgi:hypothetical protein
MFEKYFAVILDIYRSPLTHLKKLTFQVMWKSFNEKPNPLTPFPTREGGRRFKVSLLVGERFRERFFRSREKSAF